MKEIAENFQIYGNFLESRPYGSGHINDTFVAAFSQAGVRVRYIFQRINNRVFQQPELLMENIVRVTSQATAQLEEEGIPDSSRRALRVIPARDGKPYYKNGNDRYWRCYLFIEGARTYDIVESEEQAYQAARAFGEFQKLASSLGGKRLHETIPNFHNSRSRLEDLKRVVETNPFDRLSGVAAEWNFIRQREDLVDVLLRLQEQGEIPERITHNDTKLNNVMIDDATETGICVLDLDTVMPGLALYDFGDMVRATTSPAAEDERDLSKVGMQFPMFEALVRGYLSSARDFLNEAEIEHLVFAGKLMVLECGIRFLQDHLQGDTYFKIHRPDHNLDRCRTQLRLIELIEEQEEAMKELVRKVAK